MLVIMRLCLLARILDTAPPQLLMILALTHNAERSWLKTVKADWKWIKDKAELPEFMRTMTWMDLVAFIRTNPKAAKKRFKKLLQDATLRKIVKWATAKSIVQHAQVHQCEVCGACKHDYQALAVHRFSEHGMRVAMHCIVAEEHTCGCCLQHFHDRPRLIAHLHVKSQRCGTFYKATRMPNTAEMQKTLDEQDKLANRNRYSKGLRMLHTEGKTRIRAEGPLHPTAVEYGIDHKNRLKCLWKHIQLPDI